MIEEEFEGDTIDIVDKLNVQNDKNEIIVDSDIENSAFEFPLRERVVENTASDSEDVIKKVVLDNIDMIHSHLTAKGAVFNTHEPHEDVKVLEELRESITAKISNF